MPRPAAYRSPPLVAVVIFPLVGTQRSISTHNSCVVSESLSPLKWGKLFGKSGDTSSPLLPWDHVLTKV